MFTIELLSDNFLIVADSGRRNLIQIGLDSGQMVLILPVKLTAPIAVAYDSINRVVYWTDVAQRSIGKFALSGATTNSIQALYTATEGHL